MSDVHPELRYARPPKWYQRRRLQRWLWVALAVVVSPFLVAGGVVAWGYCRDAWVTRQNRIALAACERYVAPAGQVVFEMDRGVVTRRVVAAPWQAWWAWSSVSLPAPGWSYPTVFMHRLDDRAPTGLIAPSHLVVTEIHPHLTHAYDGRTIQDRPVLSFDAIQVWTVNRTRSGGSTSGSTALVILPGPEDHVRVFAGRTVAGDPSAFEFDVEFNGRRQRVVGWLEGNLVRLEAKAGTTLRPPEWKYAEFWIPDGASAEHEAQVRAVAASPGQPSPTTWPLPAWWTPASTAGATTATSRPAGDVAG